MKQALVLAFGCAVGCTGGSSPGEPIKLTFTESGRPRAVVVVTHDVDGTPIEVLDAPDGALDAHAPAGGAITAFDVENELYMVSWLGVQPGDELRDGKEPSASLAVVAAPPQQLVPHRLDITNVGANIRFLRGRIDARTATGILAGPEVSLEPTPGTVTLATSSATDSAISSVVLYSNSDAPESVSTWLYQETAGEIETVDAATALPAIHNGKATVSTDRGVTVDWIEDAPLAVQAGRLQLSWHGENEDVFHEWSVRFPYTGAQVVMPSFADDDLVARLPEASPDLSIFAEIVLLDFADPAAADAFRRDTQIVGRSIIGANRDLFYLGILGVRRLVLDTPF